MSEEKKVKITIDDREYEVEKGKSVLQAALENGIDIPYFCYHPKLSIAGACRMCVVYWENINRLVISCNTPVQEGMVIRTHHTSELVKDNQKYLLQALMTRHPLDCPICDKAGECDLQNLGAIYGPQRQIVPISALEKERHELDWESDFLEYYSNRCVVCYRCTRACDEIVGARALYVEERGFHSNIVPSVRPMDTSSCEMCGICVYVCPVGAIISKPFKFWSRSWLLQKGRTGCNLCPVGCEIQLEYGVGDWRSKRKVYRTKPTDELNVCAKAFFGYDAINRDRLLKPTYHGKEETPGNVANFLSSILQTHKDEAALILSSYLSNEVYETLKEVASSFGAYVSAPVSADFFKVIEGYGDYRPLTLEDIKGADYYLLIGEDITSTAPVLSYYLKGKVYKIGSSSRDEKLKPQYIDWKDIDSLEGKGVLILNTYSFSGNDAVEVGRIVKEIEARKGVRVLLLPKDGNTYGLYETFKDKLSDVDAVLEKVAEGEIRSLVIFGEDLYDYYRHQELLSKLDRLEHLIVITPYRSELTSKAVIEIPMPLMGESEGTYTTLMGKTKVRKFLPWAFDDRIFWETLKDNLKDSSDIPVLKSEGASLSKREIHIYRSNWIMDRSENLAKLFSKNAQPVA